jgi:hypothetical protein
VDSEGVVRYGGAESGEWDTKVIDRLTAPYGIQNSKLKTQNSKLKTQNPQLL